jgi:hypothetical protein
MSDDASPALDQQIADLETTLQQPSLPASVRQFLCSLRGAAQDPSRRLPQRRFSGRGGPPLARPC